MPSSFCLILLTALTASAQIPPNFVSRYYAAYSEVPKASRLAPFYADSVIIDDPTYDWVGEGKAAIFKNFDRNNEKNHYTWRVDQVIEQGEVLVTEGLLTAKYAGVPYEMRFVNIFHFKDGLIVKQYDYFDNKDYFKAVEKSKSEP